MILTPMEAFIGIAMNVVSRRFEWEADRFACELPDRFKEPEMEDMGDRLGRALITLHVKNLSTVWVDWMCVVFLFFIMPRIDGLLKGIRRTTIHIRHSWSDSRRWRGSRRSALLRKRRRSKFLGKSRIQILGSVVTHIPAPTLHLIILVSSE